MDNIKMMCCAGLSVRQEALDSVTFGNAMDCEFRKECERRATLPWCQWSLVAFFQLRYNAPEVKKSLNGNISNHKGLI
jgi:hypothetical protein